MQSNLNSLANMNGINKYIWLVLFVLFPCHLNAQLTFLWPSKPVNPVTYSSLDQCLALSQRLSDSIRSHRSLDEVFAPLNYVNANEGFSNTVISSVLICIEKFNLDSLKPLEKRVMQKLLLITNQDSLAEAIIEDELVRLSLEHDTIRAREIQEYAWNYLLARPARLDAAARLVDSLYRVNNKYYTALHKLGITLSQFSNARVLGDTALAVLYANNSQVWYDSLSRAERASDLYRQRLAREFRESVRYLSGDSMVTALARSTEDMHMVFAKAFSLSSGSGSKVEFNKEAFHVNAIAGDFFFPQDSGNDDSYECLAQEFNMKIPKPHRISLMVFLSHPSELCFERQGCWSALYVIKRLKEAFPQLEITLAMPTRGYFQETEPPSPVQEATYLCKTFLDHYKLPVSLVVYETPFFRLPGFDRRRINETTPNEENILKRLSGRLTERGYFEAYIIDDESLMVWNGNLTISNEELITKYLTVLMRRSK